MNKSRIFVVEDDPLIADSLQSTIEDMGHECVGLSDNAFDALSEILTLMPDLVLLDINIEGDKDGVDIAISLQKKTNVPFIFVTAYADSRTVERCKAVNPVGYIVKPFREIDIQVAIEMALAKKDVVDDKMMRVETDRFLYFKENSEYIKVDSEDILFIKANDIYSDLHLLGQKILITKPLKKMDEILNQKDFVRVHRSYIINLTKMEKIVEDQVLIDGNYIPIGRSFKTELMGRLHIV